MPRLRFDRERTAHQFDEIRVPERTQWHDPSVAYQLPNGVGILEVADDGAGIQDHDLSKPTHKTLGTSLIAKLARQLKGRVETDSVDGMTVRIVMTRSTAAKQVSV